MGNPDAQLLYNPGGASSSHASDGGFRKLWKMPDRNYSFTYTLADEDGGRATRVEFHGLDTNG
jgi:hypothetical protein